MLVYLYPVLVTSTLFKLIKMFVSFMNAIYFYNLYISDEIQDKYNIEMKYSLLSSHFFGYGNFSFGPWSEGK